MSPPRYADVLIPVAVDRPYSYRIPEGMELAPGDVVAVPLGPRTALGAVWALRDQPGGVSHNRLKDIAYRYDSAAVPHAVRQLCDWIADYTLAQRGMVLRMALRHPDDLAPPKPRIGVRITEVPPGRMTPARKKVLAVLADGLARAKGEAAREAGVSGGVIDGLVDEGALETILLPAESVAEPLDADYAATALNDAQQEAARHLRDAVAARTFSVALLDGVTGSGKTEVYFEAIAENIRRGKQTLILMPEIALTGQFLDRFAQRFGVRPLEWHSELTPRTRARNWAAISEGKVPVVVGARSALFLPYADLGLIIVDEEHDQAYKQEDGAHYHARDMAVVRAHIAKIPIVLASATPSVESEVNARKGRYQRVALPSRFGGQHMPHIEAIDMRRAPPPRGRFISPVLAEQIRHAIERREQALLFLNRRGYAPLTLCRACGHRFACTICDAWLVDHRFRQPARLPPLRLQRCRRPTICPQCAAEDSRWSPVGPGVERFAGGMPRRMFPRGAAAMVLSSDRHGRRHRDACGSELEARWPRGASDIVIGTQLVAKGHNFPHLALVGVIDADLGLSNSDPRAGERTFQLLQQVVGRAGRAKDGSRALIQTHQPDHPIIRAIVRGDREGFYAAEIAMREEARLPPFGRLAALVVSAEAQADAFAYARSLVRSAPPSSDVQVLGPAEAPLALVRGRHRVRLLARSARAFDLSGWMRGWLSRVEAPRGNVRLEIDVDPQSFL
jgi:primosomal protein N' (replication factor Y)